MRTFTIAVVGAASSLVAASDFAIDSGASVVAGEFVFTAETAGTLIGDYDPDANPDGTRTLPGLFGGSGNNPIPLTLDVESSTDLDLSPGGGFSLDADTDALTFMIGGFEADLLNGETIASSLGLTLEYETFRTVNPDGLFLGGIPLPIDLDAGELTALTLEQTGPMDAPGALVPQGDGSFALAGVLPAELTLAGSTLGGAPIEPGPVPVALPIAGTLTPGPDGSATVELTIELDGLSGDADTSDLPPLPEIPFELPTLSGETAGVVLSLSVNTVGVQTSGTVSLVATGEPGGCNAADLGEPFGVLDLADLSAFISAFTAQDAAADLDGNGVYDLADVQAFVTAFQAGCP